MRFFVFVVVPFGRQKHSPLAVRADDAYPLRSALRDKLSLAKIAQKISFLMTFSGAISAIVFATGSLALRGLTIVG